MTRQGFTLLELALVLLAVGLIVGVIWVAAAKTFDRYRVSRATEEVIQIVRNIRDHYNGAPVLTGGDITTDLDAANIFPVEMRRDYTVGGPIDHPFNSTWPNGSLHVQAVSNIYIGGAGVTVSWFGIRMEGLSQAACIEMLTSLPVSDTELGVGAVGTQNMVSMIMNPTSEISPTTAQGWCDQAGANNEVDWDFHLH